jgi:hypothetical protein
MCPSKGDPHGLKKYISVHIISLSIIVFIIVKYLIQRPNLLLLGQVHIVAETLRLLVRVT